MGITDSLDATTAAKGSMQTLSNLIPDPSTFGVFHCRPASQLLVDFNTAGSGGFSSGFSSGFQTLFFSGGTAGDIVALRVIGNRVFGMISGPGGFDYPFVYNLVTNGLQLVTGGMDTTKLPNTVSAAAEWSLFPPSIAGVGTKVLVCHPGFSGSGPNNLFFGVFDATDANNITWTAGNLDPGSAIHFNFPPWAVENFNGRAYWITNPPTGQPGVVFSDVLVPTNCTGGTQALTFDDQQPLTALVPLPLNNQLGGIIQGLMVFKGTASIYQVTGDAALNNLAKNALNIATGTTAPLAAAVTPKGIAFMSPDGYRIIDFDAQVSDPIGWDGQGKTAPFINAANPNRTVAAATGTTFRVSVRDTTLFNNPLVEYWFDTTRGLWTGPHQFSNNTAPQAIGAWHNSFITSIKGVPGKLWRSDVFPTPNSSFTENGAQLTWQFTTTFLPDTEQMAENSIIETTINMAIDTNTSYPVNALDQNGGTLASATIFFPAASAGPIWGSSIWGAFTWGAPKTALFPRPVNWPVPVVFQKMQIGVSGNSSANVKIGVVHLRYEKLGYLQQGLVA